MLSGQTPVQQMSSLAECWRSYSKHGVTYLVSCDLSAPKAHEQGHHLDCLLKVWMLQRLLWCRALLWIPVQHLLEQVQRCVAGQPLQW